MRFSTQHRGRSSDDGGGGRNGARKPSSSSICSIATEGSSFPQGRSMDEQWIPILCLFLGIRPPARSTGLGTLLTPKGFLFCFPYQTLMLINLQCATDKFVLISKTSPKLAPPCLPTIWPEFPSESFIESSGQCAMPFQKNRWAAGGTNEEAAAAAAAEAERQRKAAGRRGGIECLFFGGSRQTNPK